MRLAATPGLPTGAVRSDDAATPKAHLRPYRCVMPEAPEHPVTTFRRRLGSLAKYPPGVVPVPAYLQGTAFFSAAAGLVVHDPDGPLPPFPFGGVMFVGHNLDSESAFRRRLASGQAHGGPGRPMLTWRNLYRLLDAAGLDAQQCFFTNAYVGLKGGDDPTGRFPGAGDPEFRAWCRAFLDDQIELMQPRVVATLGTDARRFVAALAPELSGWAPSRNPPPGVVRSQIGGRATALVALLHPSGYHGSLGRRRYRDLTGLDAEAALLRDALEYGSESRRRRIGS